MAKDQIFRQEFEENYEVVRSTEEVKLDFSKKTPYTWGLNCIDHQLGRPDLGELIVFAGYAGIGKTEFSYFMARRNAILGNKTTILTLELPVKSMIQRYVYKKFGYDKLRSQTEDIPQERLDKMTAMGKKLLTIENLKYESLVGICDINAIESIIHTQYQDGHKLFFVDNLGKITGDPNENVRFEEITSKLQDLKNQLDICIILVHHLKKPTNDNKQFDPGGIAAFRGSQKVIDNATQVIEIWRNKDPNTITQEIKAEIRLYQYKDTGFGQSGLGEFYFYEGEYHEQYTPDFE